MNSYARTIGVNQKSLRQTGTDGPLLGHQGKQQSSQENRFTGVKKHLVLSAPPIAC